MDCKDHYINRKLYIFQLGIWGSDPMTEINPTFHQNKAIFAVIYLFFKKNEKFYVKKSW